MTKKTKGRTLSFILLLVVLLSVAVMNYRARTGTSKELNIYCWDMTFKELLAENYPAYDAETDTIGEVKINWVVNPDLNGTYQLELEHMLTRQNMYKSKDSIDIFLLEADFVRKYTSTDEYALSLRELGITEEDQARQYPYTRQAAKDAEGVERGIAYQATPGVMLYRRDMAREIFGTDAPENIQTEVSNWTRFEQTARRVKAADGYMLSGFFDTYRVVANGRHAGWLRGAEITLGPELAAWVEQTLRFADNNLTMGNELWDWSWKNSVRTRRVFCFFGPAWFINNTFIMASLAQPPAAGGKKAKGNGTYGLWGVCRGPQPFFWGGTWICASKNTDNKELVADIMRTLCCDTETARRMCYGERLIFPNNRTVTQERADSSQPGLDFLDGQNPYTVMVEVAEELPDPLAQMTPYDNSMHELFCSSCSPYFRRQESWNQAWQRFLASIWMKHPDLQDAASLQ